jgi:hypothetical protein
MSTQDADERREYYRIVDSIALEIRLLAQDAQTSADEPHDESVLFNLLADLHATDFESQHLLRQIGERDRAVAGYLKTVNKRIDLLGQIIAQQLLRDIAPARQVILSEGGVSFSDAQGYAIGDLMAIRMVLLPQALGLLLKARVVHCQAKGDGEFEIGAEFEELQDSQRQLLARHILQRQAQARRLAREQAALS